MCREITLHTEQTAVLSEARDHPPGEQGFLALQAAAIPLQDPRLKETPCCLLGNEKSPVVPSTQRLLATLYLQQKAGCSTEGLLLAHNTEGPLKWGDFPLSKALGGQGEFQKSA